MIQKIIVKNIIVLLVLVFSNQNFAQNEYSIWDKVSIKFLGPETNELESVNPFTDYRLDVKFTNQNGEEFLVPGFYDADGNCAETSSRSGNVWRVNFTPNMLGVWHYKANFVKGKMIACTDSKGESAKFFDGKSGEFKVTNKTQFEPIDFRSKGKLVYNGESYLQFLGSKDYFLKAGVNSPEVFLEYKDFDNTPSKRNYDSHIADWNNDDPTWQNGKGKGIIGAINYISSLGLNSLYFMPMNAYGDGKNAWPWVAADSIYRYDCSKLAQWEIVFDHMIKKGVMPHFVLSETENEALFEIKENGKPGGFANARKLFYREIIARYGYLTAVTWNIGEENGWAEGDNYHIANTDEQRKMFSDYLRKLTYYNDNIVIHNGPSTDDHIYTKLLGVNSLTGTAFQWNYDADIYSKVLEWNEKSGATGHKWVFSMDEPWLDPEIGDINIWRKNIVWGTYLAGGAGVELYIGAGLDLVVENFRKYEKYYKESVRVKNFIVKNFQFQKLEPLKGLSENCWIMKEGDSRFLVYKHSGNSIKVRLPKGKYSIKWYNDQKEKEIISSKNVIESTGEVFLIDDFPGRSSDDWILILSKI